LKDLLVKSVEQYLTECARQYYQGNPIISDEVFDRLADSVGFSKVGARQHEHIQKHYFPMYSLKKFYVDEGKENPLVGEKDITVSPKLDGAAISILYIDGALTRVLTRGDGTEGTNITENFLKSTLIPKNIRYEGVLQITGEVAAPSHIPNARNYASGALNLKDSSDFLGRAITFFAYGVQPYVNDTYDEDMIMLKKMGFNTIKDSEIDKVYPSDGIVFRVNSNKRTTELGYSSDWPNFAYARKERPEGVITKLVGVEWNTSKSGKVTPVALLEPVYIDDALVSRATLNNPGFIEALDLHIGDTVHVIRAGMIIPCITHKIDG
jgi:NAD-dependent DNA ligase